MPSDPANPEAIRAKAAQLLIRRDAGWTAEEAAEFALWRAADPAHEAAVRKVEAAQRLLAQLAHAPGAAAMRDEVEELSRDRRVVRPMRWRLWMGVVAAAACLALGIAMMRTVRPPAATILAATNLPRTVDLSDGSTLRLEPGSSVELGFSTVDRHLTLRHGAAHFSVARDATRPCVVSAGDVAVRAVGTAFTVRHVGTAVEVGVTEGKVQVTSSTVRWRVPLFLVAGERVTLPRNGVVAGASAEAAPGVKVTRLPAPRLEFSDTPLAEVLARFNQFSRIQVELGDSDLALRRVGGTFDADRAEVFVDLLSAAGDVKVERVSETHFILRKAR